MAAWIGLVPPQDSTGGKQKLGPISKHGDRYLRRILDARFADCERLFHAMVSAHFI
jgi:transposase